MTEPMAPAAEWEWVQPRPTDWEPQVVPDGDHITVTFLTFSGLGQEAIYRHTDVYGDRNIEEELRLIEAVRAQMVRILRTLPPMAFKRTGIHSVEGPIALKSLLDRITNHFPHHVQFIEEKRQAIQR